MIPHPQTEVQPHSRPFLERVPPQQRGPLCNLFLAPPRSGLTDPAAVVQAVREETMCRAHAAQRWHQSATHAKMLALLRLLKAHPDESLDLARWAIAWDAMPSAERAQIKAQRGETYRRQWQAEQPATPKQIRYLEFLGHRVPVASRLEASALIDRLRQGGRQRIEQAILAAWEHEGGRVDDR
jgi:hypothetical protein